MVTKLLLDLASGRISRRDSLAACLERIGSDPSAAGIFSHVDTAGLKAMMDNPPAATTKADALSGIVAAVSDSLLVKGMPAEASSTLLAGFVAPYDATAVERLKGAGAALAGKLRVPELGIAPAPGEPEGKAADRSAEAVAKGMCHAALGVDSGGEFRFLAAAGGQFAIKPSYGAVSRHGIVSAAPSMEAVGVVASGVADLIPVLHTVTGHDPKDITTTIEPLPDLTSESRKGLKDLRVGWIDELGGEGAREGVDALVKKGAAAVKLSLPSARHWDAVHSILFHAEAGSQLGRYDGIRFGRYPVEARDWDSVYYQARAAFGPAVKRAAMLGAFALSHEGIDVYHQKALRLRERICREFAKAWETVDIVVVSALLDPHGLAARRGANLAGCPALALAGRPLEIWAAPFKAYNALRAGMAMQGE